jgi:hypothetical protein
MGAVEAGESGASRSTMLAHCRMNIAANVCSLCIIHYHVRPGEMDGECGSGWHDAAVVVVVVKMRECLACAHVLGRLGLLYWAVSLRICLGCSLSI